MPKTDSTYDVYPYTIDRLKQLIVERSGKTSLRIIEKKLHTTYFEEYFGPTGVNARTIVVEKCYVDRDYLEDFAGYYVRCFQTYKHISSRLHFFDCELTRRQLTYAITGRGRATIERLRKGYLGFVVVKPLPQTVIGRTCLKTYDNAEGQRFYPIGREYDANLFGIPLKVNTLAFQEQDSVVAACASSALWSALHGTGVLFHHKIPSPVEITRLATKYSALENRTFPNHGLTALQMSHAIREVGLEPIYYDTKDPETLKSLVYGYLRGGVPIVMGVELWDVSDPDHPKHNDDDYHAITITGFRLPHGTTPIPDPDTNTMFVSSCISELYAHDDQVGPFSRITFDGIKVAVTTDGIREEKWSVHSSWQGDDEQIGSVRMIPYMLLVPVYHKVRIPLSVIKQTVGMFDALIEAANFAGVLAIPERPRWSVYLTTINKYRSVIGRSRPIGHKERLRHLSENSPRFIWRAKASVNNQRAIDLLFDATDIEQGRCFHKAVVHDRDVALEIKKLSAPGIMSHFEGTQIEGILKWLESFR